MDVKAAKQALHEMIDRIEDNELLNLYVKLLERELSRSGEGFITTSDKDLITRAETSIKSIEEGNVRSLEEFTNDVEKWKKNRNMQ
jgi:hypothetical protein